MNFRKLLKRGKLFKRHAVKKMKNKTLHNFLSQVMHCLKKLFRNSTKTAKGNTYIVTKPYRKMWTRNYKNWDGFGISRINTNIRKEPKK